MKSVKRYLYGIGVAWGGAVMAQPKPDSLAMFGAALLIAIGTLGFPDK